MSTGGMAEIFLLRFFPLGSPLGFPSARGLRVMVNTFLPIRPDVTSWLKRRYWEKSGTGWALLWLGGSCILDIFHTSYIPTGCWPGPQQTINRTHTHILYNYGWYALTVTRMSVLHQSILGETYRTKTYSYHDNIVILGHQCLSWIMLIKVP